jgi:hypothetical protein
LGLGLDSPPSLRLTGDISVLSTRSAHLTLISDFGLSGLGDGDFLRLGTLYGLKHHSDCSQNYIKNKKFSIVTVKYFIVHCLILDQCR